MDMGQSIPSFPPGWLSAQYYSNLPHNEVNWASLAQQWIAMRQAGPDPSTQQENHGQTPSGSQAPSDVPVYPPNSADFSYHQIQSNSDESQPQSQGSLGQANQDGGNNCLPPDTPDGQSSFDPSRPARAAGPLLATPQVPPLPEGYYPPSTGDPSATVPVPGQYPAPIWASQGYAGARLPTGIRQNQPEPGDPINAAFYQETGDWYAEQSQTVSHLYPNSAYGGAAMGYGSAMGFNQDMDYRKWKPPFYNAKTWMIDDRSSSNSPDYPSLDQTQRKFLPAWIREGLEKMEREKSKKEQEAQEKEEAAKKKLEERKKKGKSKFESDTESDNDEAEQNNVEKVVDDNNGERIDSPVEERAPSESKKKSPHRRVSRFSRSPVSAEEYKDQVIGLLKRWMTEILLEVTDSEISEISDSVHAKFLKKAQPKMLAQSSALAAITTFGDVGSDSDSSNDEESASEDEPKEAEGFKMPLGPPSVVRAMSKQRNQSKPITLQPDTPSQSVNGQDTQISDPYDGTKSDKLHGESDNKRHSSSSSAAENSTSGEKEKNSSKSDRRHHHKSSRRSRSRSKSRDRDRKHKRRSKSKDRGEKERKSHKSSSSRSSKHKRRSKSKDRGEKKSRKDND